MTTPTITPLPKAPSRQNAAGTFATLADNFMQALPPFGDQVNQLAAYIDQRAEDAAESAALATTNGATQVTAATQKANAAAQSAQTAATQADNARAQAEISKASRDTAQAAAAAAQSSAGLPAVAGRGGFPLVARPDDTGVEYTGSLRRYDLDVNPATSVLDLAAGQVFQVDASVARTLSFVNPPAAGRAMTVVVHITGAVQVTWPGGILWNNSQVPVQGAAWTTVILIWVGTGWVGSVGARS
jgi:FKBP-type peptidyl-prolyl cis-trans isomerase